MVETIITFFIAAFSSLFTIVNPFSTASVFNSITKSDSADKKRLMAKKASVVAAVVLIIFALAGSFILSFFSITVEAFRIAGGILVAGVGMKMVHATREVQSSQEKKEALDKDDVSVIPLAIPMLSGPGAMTTAIVLMSQSPRVIDKAMVFIAILAVCFISFFVLSHANIIDKYLGETRRRVLDRIMGLIVMVVGIQFIINGVGGLIVTWI